jgi:hypothetical protein
MKKVLLALILLASAFVFFGTKSFAAGTGNLVIHFQKWDGDYTNVGLFTWTSPLTNKTEVDGTDSFGVYFQYNDIAVGENLFAIIYFQEAGKEWWENKLTSDIEFGQIVQEGKTVHVYVFEGADTAGSNRTAFYVANPEAYNLLLVYYDPTGSYEEDLGVHAWNGWTSFTEPGWASPAKVFSNGGKASDGSIVKVAMLSASSPNAGLLIYAGGDENKKTGDVNLSAALPASPVLGNVGVAYVLSKGDAYTANDNVFYNDPATFSEQSFSFRLIEFNAEDKSGTYAVDKNTIIVKTSSLVTNPYANAETQAEKDAAVAAVKSWFTVREITGATTYGDPLAIERVDFARSNATLNAFVVILADELDNTKNYEVFFKTTFQQALAVAVDVQVTLNVTVPANTPAEAVLSVAGSMQGWTPGQVAYSATKVGATLVYTLNFTVSVTQPFTTFEYKWTRGSWPTEEFVASNRKLIIPNNVTAITFEDVIEAWADINPPAEKYAAPDRVAPELPADVEASLVLDLDRTAPVLTFISPVGIIGKVPAERIIIVAWGQPFNQNLFPRFRVIDDRDGEITPFVYVPKGQFSVLDTRTEGDYTIMLRVVDRWGNVTEETFIFRVTK